MNEKWLSSLRFWSIWATIVGLALFLTLQTLAQGPNLIKNGDFEDGFVEGVGVAENWESFDNGKARAGFYDDTWELVVVEGEHAQLIELVDATESDAYAGIYQTVEVTAGQTYQFSFKGLVRSDEGSIDVSNYGYRLEYAIDLSGNQDWQQVTEWVELPWDEQPRTGPESGAGFTFNSLETTFTATGDSVTIFIRAWKKWADQGEGNYNIDAVRLVALESSATATPPPTTPYRDPATEPLPETGGEAESGNTANAIWLTASAVVILLLIGGAFLGQRRRPSGP